MKDYENTKNERRAWFGTRQKTDIIDVAISNKERNNVIMEGA